MKVKSLDHFVLTTKNLEQSLHFYRDVLGMRVEEREGRYALFFGTSKINIHQRPAEFLPAAAKPQHGSLDFCLIVEDTCEALVQELSAKGVPVELGPVGRHGARGAMKSIYLRDPDGNLVELCHYEKVE
ncbi:VOC family protein [Mitsuokella sp. WILCCON 0060]|uniref:VOC family protein n=1 Tax=Mitsuokella sp. WILCCON 0060 TaxID=3345341 RepID=UPI003F1D29EE